MFLFLFCLCGAGILMDGGFVDVMSVLDANAATDDLAQLINHLDLEATPAPPSPERHRSSPYRPRESPVRQRVLALESPVKKKKTKSGGGAGDEKALPPIPAERDRGGRQIAPWPLVDWSSTSPLALGKTHKRTLTPAPAIDPPPVFQPLRPAGKSNPNLAPIRVSPLPPPLPVEDTRSPSALTFGSGSSEEDPAPSPVFKKQHVRQRSSLVPVEVRDKQDVSRVEGGRRDSFTITRRVGGSTSTVNAFYFRDGVLFYFNMDCRLMSTRLFLTERQAQSRPWVLLPRFRSRFRPLPRC